MNSVNSELRRKEKNKDADYRKMITLGSIMLTFLPSRLRQAKLHTDKVSTSSTVSEYDASINIMPCVSFPNQSFQIPDTYSFVFCAIIEYSTI